MASGEVHVWWTVQERTPSFRRSLANTLSSDERQRAARYRFERDRWRFTVRRGTLRTLLAAYLGKRPEEVRICYGRAGKPRLSDHSIQFSLSHSGNIALYAFGRSQELGVDIEQMREIGDLEPLVLQFFSEREGEDFLRLPQCQRGRAFFRCWTRKEAFLKAVGTGLTRPLDTFDVSLVPDQPARLLAIDGDSENAAPWAIHELDVAPDYAAHVALRHHGCRIRSSRWSV